MMFLLPSANLSGRVYGSQGKEDIYKIGTLIFKKIRCPQCKPLLLYQLK